MAKNATQQPNMKIPLIHPAVVDNIVHEILVVMTELHCLVAGRLSRVDTNDCHEQNSHQTLHFLLVIQVVKPVPSSIQALHH